MLYTVVIAILVINVHSFITGYFDKETTHSLLEESVKMKEFDHPNILTMLGVCVDAGPAPYIIMPFMAKGSLLSYLRKERKRLLCSEEDDVSTCTCIIL